MGAANEGEPLGVRLPGIVAGAVVLPGGSGRGSGDSSGGVERVDWRLADEETEDLAELLSFRT